MTVHKTQDLEAGMTYTSSTDTKVTQPQCENGGYRELTEFVNGSPSHTFQIFRRFGNLNVRCLLYMQDELSELEAKLAEYDASEMGSLSRRFDQHPERGALIGHITQKVQEYNSLLTSISQTLSLRPASKYQVDNFRNYFDAFNPIVNEEAGFISNETDLVSLFNTETDWLHRVLNQANLHLFSSKDKSRIVPPHLQMIKDELVLTERPKITLAVRTVALLFGLISILIPLAIFHLTGSPRVHFYVTCIFIVMFGLAMALFTTAKNSELLAALAAYAAVLVVFVGSLNG